MHIKIGSFDIHVDRTYLKFHVEYTGTFVLGNHHHAQLFDLWSGWTK